MLQVKDLKQINYISSLCNLELNTLLSYYEEVLMPLNFKYSLSDGTTIEFGFRQDRLAHLIGLQYIGEKVNIQDRYKYKGQKAWDEIRKGNMTFTTLKNNSKGAFKFIESRFLYFPSLIGVLKSPSLCIFDKSKVLKKNKKELNLKCDFIFYDDISGLYIHFGVEKNKNNTRYYPKSFFIRADNSYVAQQDKLAIISTEITDKRTATLEIIAEEAV